MPGSRHCLDLFAGLGGFSAAFEDADGWEVTTVDNEEKFDADIQADVLKLTPDDLPNADVILASPPCTAFTQMAKGAGGGKGHVSPDGRPNTETGRTGIMLAHYTRGLCRAIDPDWYIIENPNAGMVNQLGKPDATVWWCQYGADRAKPTGLWGRIPPSFDARRCHNGNENCHHEPAPRGSDSGTQSSDRSAAERAKLPYGLSKAVLRAVENPQPEYGSLRKVKG